MTEHERIRTLEKRRWAELAAKYAECVAIAEETWGERLAIAAAEQEAKAIVMRDRATVTAKDARFVVKGESGTEKVAGELHVPLFTARDRLQFLKEAAVALLISADRLNLSVTLEHSPEVPFGPHKGIPLADLDDDTLTGARDWAVDKAPSKFPDFILAANAELNRRIAKFTNQPLDAKPLALVASGNDEDFRGDGTD